MRKSRSFRSGRANRQLLARMGGHNRPNICSYDNEMKSEPMRSRLWGASIRSTFSTVHPDVRVATTPGV